VQLLCCAKNIGVDFSDTMTVGRQHMHLPPDAVASILSAIDAPRELASAILEGQFAEPLFALHDFDQPLPTSLATDFPSFTTGEP
jgi:hypothetical protein